MMEATTLSTGPTAPTPVPGRRNASPPSPASNYLDSSSPRQYRAYSRGHFDAYRSPHEHSVSPGGRALSASRNHSTGSLSALSPLSSSRKNSNDNYLTTSGSGSGSAALAIPFSNFSLHDRDSLYPDRQSLQGTSPPASLGSYGHPVLTIRRKPSAASSIPDSPFSLTDNSHPPWLEGDRSSIPRHRSRSPLPKGTTTLERRGSTGSTASSRRASIHRGSITSLGDDPSAPLSACDPETCTHHHHRRQSLSSNISIDCSDDGLQGDVEASISLEPVTGGMIIPLVDRASEMAELLSNQYNAPWVRMVIKAIGKDAYKNECMQLWTKTGRAMMQDREWLRRSRKLLTLKGPEGIKDMRLWNQFCGMVGWDGDDAELEKKEGSRKPSFGSSENVMSCIVEEDEAAHKSPAPAMKKA